MSRIIGRGRYATETYPESGAAGGLGPLGTTPYVFVLKPGAPHEGNVYPDSNSLFADVLAVRALTGDASTIVIEVNGTLAPAHWLANGVQDMSGVQFFSSQDTTQGFTLIVDDGAQWTFDALYNNGVEIHGVCATTPVATINAAGEVANFLFTWNEGTFESRGVQPFFLVQSGEFNAQFIASFLGDGVHHAVRVNVGANLFSSFFDGSVLSAVAFDPAGAGAYNVSADASTDIGVQAPVVPIITFVDLSAQLEYAPIQPSNWRPVPAIVSQAIDQLAFPNSASRLDPGQAPAASITIPGSPITQHKSGNVTVTGEASLLASGPAPTTIACQLQRDATPIGPVISLTVTLAPATYAVSVTWDDVLPAGGAPHTYSLVCTVAAGTLATSLDSGAVVATEII